jgi:hypothetical protein
MKNLKKTGKRFFALFLSLVLALGIVQTSAIAASWNPGDKITINVRVYDVSNGKTYDVGTDYATKGDVNIQSVNYKIPALTQFVNANQFGRVQKVVGNWYFPSGDSQPGANVEWSCNVNKVTMTYWVNCFLLAAGPAVTPPIPSTWVVPEARPSTSPSAIIPTIPVGPIIR